MRCLICFLICCCLSVISSAQKVFYSEDIVQSKMDSAKFSDAIFYIESLEKVDLDSALALYPKKAFCYYYIGKHTEAKKCLSIIENEILETDKTELLKLFYMIDDKNNAEDVCDELSILLDKGEDDFFELITIINKKDLKKFASYIDIFTSSLEEEDRGIFYKIASFFYFKADDRTNAYNKLSAFIDKEPTALSSYLMGLIKSEQHEYLSAVSYFNQAEDLGLKSADLFKERAKAKGFEKDFFSAIEDLNIALQKDVKAEYYFLRGVCLNYVLQYNDALYDLNTAIEMCDTIADYYNYRGIVYINLEKYADALFEFQTALKMNPNADFIHNNIGLAYEKNGFLNKAIEHYKISIRKVPYYSDSYFNLGRINYEQGKYRAAVRYLEEAYILNPNFGDITHILGLCYVALKDKEKACSYLQIAIDAGCEPAVSSQSEHCKSDEQIDDIE